MLILDIMRMKLKSLIFECINVANISSITGFMLLLDMMCNEIEVLIFLSWGVCFVYIVGTNFYTLLEHICIYCWSSYLCTSTQLYIVEAYFYALLEH
jgi:hypothetical protein